MNKTELIDALADAKLLNQAYHKPNLTFRNEQATIDEKKTGVWIALAGSCLLYTSPSPRDVEESRMPSSA